MRWARTVPRRSPRPAGAAVLALVGTAMLGVGLSGQQEAPQLHTDASAEVAPVRLSRVRPEERPHQSASPQLSAPSASSPPIRGPLLAKSMPLSVAVPSIGVDSPEIVPLGLMADGTMEVPRDYDLAGWYRHSSTPGELGPAVIVGHVDSTETGPAVFFRLAQLRPGDEVLVEREDGSTAVFAVESIRQYPKAHFPTAEVYGDIDHAGLRLITCGGTFDHATGHYRDNLVVYARLVAARPPPHLQS